MVFLYIKSPCYANTNCKITLLADRSIIFKANNQGVAMNRFDDNELDAVRFNLKIQSYSDISIVTSSSNNIS